MSDRPLDQLERAVATLRTELARGPRPRWLLLSRFGFDFLGDAARRDRPLEIGSQLLVRRLSIGSVPLLAIERDGPEPSGNDVAFQDALPLLIAGQLGLRGALLLLAASGLPGFGAAPALVPVRDWIRIGDEDPLRFIDAARLGARFPELRGLAQSDDVALATEFLSHLSLRGGPASAPPAVALARRGPSGPTDAELRAWRRLGGDLLVEGCAAEVVAARHQGVALLTLALVLDAADASPVADPGALAQAAATLLPPLAELLPALLRKLDARAAGHAEAGA